MGKQPAVWAAVRLPGECSMVSPSNLIGGHTDAEESRTRTFPLACRVGCRDVGTGWEK